MKRLPVLLLVAATLCGGCRDVTSRQGGPELPSASAGQADSLSLWLTGPISLELVADFNIPTDTSFDAVAGADFGGISGLFFDPDRKEIVAVSDNRASNRYFTLDVQLDGESITLTPVSMTHLEDMRLEGAEALGEDGRPNVRRVFDPESIALAPDGNLFVSSEGSAMREPRIAPAIAEYRPGGELVRFLPVPDKFLPEAEGPQTKGVANNLAFESLTVSPDGSRLFTATEAALVQDDTPSDFDKGSRARILEIGIEGETAGSVKEYVYVVEPMTAPYDFEPIAGENGLVELLALDNTELLALERNFVRGGTAVEPLRRNVIRLFRVSLKGATDVAEIFSLAGQELGAGGGIVPARKELILDFDDIVPALSPTHPELDNFEGLSFGPTLADGSPSLIVVSDNNFNPWQRTSFLLFRIRID
jgi:hypothetical protein